MVHLIQTIKNTAFSWSCLKVVLNKSSFFQVYLRADSKWAIGAISLSIVGIIITLFVVIVFARHNNTPIVKAAGRELSYVLLSGILLCYSITFLLVLRPTDVVCALQR